MKYYINGKYVKENDAKISIHDMGLHMDTEYLKR